MLIVIKNKCTPEVEKQDMKGEKDCGGSIHIKCYIVINIINTHIFYKV